MSKDTPSAESVEKVYAQLDDNDQLTVDISEMVGLSRSTTRRCLKALFDQGRAERDVVTNGWHRRLEVPAGSTEANIHAQTVYAASGEVPATGGKRRRIDVDAAAATGSLGAWTSYLMSSGWSRRLADADVEFMNILVRSGHVDDANLKQLGISRWTVTRLRTGKHKLHRIRPVIHQIDGSWYFIYEDV